jgi:acyl carrier protein
VGYSETLQISIISSLAGVLLSQVARCRHISYSERKMAMEEKIRQYLATLIDRFDLLGNDDELITTMFLDSIQALQLVSFVEKEFGIQVEAEEIDIDNFHTVNALANLIRRKRQ